MHRPISPSSSLPGTEPQQPQPQPPSPSSERAPSAIWWKALKYAAIRAQEKKLPQVAASLTYTTVLSLVPLLAVVLSLFTAFPIFAEFRYALENFLAGSVMPAVVSDTVMSYLNEFAAKASGLTTIGGLVLIVTSAMLFRTIDDTFNDIWQVETRRPLRQRVLVYWALLSLGPILIGATLWALSVVARESMGMVRDMPLILDLTLRLLPLVLTGTGFTALFFTVPNRSVRWRDALVGGFTTAVILEILRVGIAFYLSKFPTYTIIYGAFATIPIFLLWVYLSWLVILLGATLTALLPALRQRRWNQRHYTGGPLVGGIRLLHVLWRAWHQEQTGRTVIDLCATVGMHQDEVDNLLHTLKQNGYVANTDIDDEEVWLLACDPARCNIERLIDVWLIDTTQPGLRHEPELIRAISHTLEGRQISLDTLFGEECTTRT